MLRFCLLLELALELLQQLGFAGGALNFLSNPFSTSVLVRIPGVAALAYDVDDGAVMQGVPMVRVTKTLEKGQDSCGHWTRNENF